ncbi:DNA-packaging protein [Microvirga thermotolerans]|uniref:ATP-binding protein n=1 Tax=Microvirga thermotolerans TaxID=2651334 RepID=A0A5P9JXD7_9HYPH|nr:terminase family protein [Microvirga thermotolerans]QFU17093.1 ATP-binding protein [Microvirga thermotolerans]
MSALWRRRRLAEATASWCERDFERVLRYWPLRCRAAQRPPGLSRLHDPWTVWLLLGGRGAGKTRAGAEWVRGIALGEPGFAQPPLGRIALIGETFADARNVMVEGPAGILAVHGRSERPTWSPSLRRLEWPNGAVAQVFSAEDPDSLRGPQFAAAWADELAKWRHADETWDMLQFGLRLGAHPRQMVTTTPRPIPLLRRFLADPSVAVSRAKTADNAENLAPAFLETVVGRYAGTRLGRQELDGEIVEDRPDALWTREGLELGRCEVPPPLARIVVAVDPPATSSRRADACGIVAAGVDEGGTAYVLADATAAGLKPPQWGEKAVALYRRLEADALVVETNQGGDMALQVIREIDPGAPVVGVRAMRGKYLRAEPVSVLYAQGRVRHAGVFPELEDELCDFGPGGLSGGRSPDRLDALVWALTELMLREAAEPRVRVL